MDAIANLFQALLDQHAAIEPAFELRAAYRARLPQLVGRWLADTDCAVFVCDRVGVVAGFCGVRIERAPGALWEGARAEIGEIAVAPATRRLGIGRALAEAAREWAIARGAARLEVRVAVRNREGQAFWRALGYEGFVDILARRL